MANAEPKIKNPKSSFRRAILALALFGVSFGYVEAAVVVYLRALSEPARATAFRRPIDPSLTHLFPLLTPADLRSAGPVSLSRTLKIEMGREAATMAMLAGIAIAVGSTFTESAAAFAMTFGIWDLAFYGFLRIFIHWPASLATWDLLFLLPVPWSGPVLAPMLVSISMIAGGWTVLRRASRGERVRLSRVHWALIFVGAVMIVLAFTRDFQGLLAGGMPHDFHWLLFAGGEACGVGAFLHALKQRPEILVRHQPIDAPLASPYSRRDDSP